MTSGEGKEQMSKEKMILLLEAELEKPIEEMDAELIQHILKTLEPLPSLEQQHASWEKIKRVLIAKGYLVMPVNQ